MCVRERERGSDAKIEAVNKADYLPSLLKGGKERKRERECARVLIHESEME